MFGNDYRVTNVDDCLSHCSNKNKSYAAISIRYCYCSNRLADVSKANDFRCNVNCNSNPRQICGSSSHYSIYNTTERLRHSLVFTGENDLLFVVWNVTYTCIPGSGRAVTTGAPDWVVPTVWRSHTNGLGYVGCYPVSPAWQNFLGSHGIVTSVDDCLNHCSNKTKSYAAILIQTCYCSNRLADVSRVNDRYCNVNCNSNPRQICGSSSHFSVYNTIERLHHSPGVPGENSLLLVGNVTYSCTPGFDRAFPTEQLPDTNANVWLRIVIDVAVIISVLSFIILCFVVRLCVGRRYLRSPPARHDDASADVTNPERAAPILYLTQSTQTSVVGGTLDSPTGTVNIGEQGSWNNPISGLQHLPEGNYIDLMRDRTPSLNFLGHTYSDVIPKATSTGVTAPTPHLNGNEGADVSIIHSYATFTTKDHPVTSTGPEKTVHDKVEASGGKKSVMLNNEGYAQLLKGDNASFPDQNLRQNTSKRSLSQRGPSQRDITVQDEDHVGGAQGGLRNEELIP